jgi:hypothetical protein
VAEPTNCGEGKESKVPVLVQVTMPRPLLLCVFIALFTASLSAQRLEAKFSADKNIYLVGEPAFITLSVSNKSDSPVWVDFTASREFCENFDIEVTGAQTAHERWGCGWAGSCGRGVRAIPAGKAVSVRELVNSKYLLQQPGLYEVSVHTTVRVYEKNAVSALINKFDVDDTVDLELQSGNESQLRAAFQPIIRDLNNPDAATRAYAVAALTELAPPFLDDTLIELTKTMYAPSAIIALRKANTPKARKTLADIAVSSDDLPDRIAAINQLARAGDKEYLALLTSLMSSQSELQAAAAEAAAVLGGEAVVAQLTALAYSPDANAAIAGTNGLAHTRAHEAVPILIDLLRNSHQLVRQAAVSGLTLLTHRVSLTANTWTDVVNPDSAARVHAQWLAWWNTNGRTAETYGMADCSSPDPLD